MLPLEGGVLRVGKKILTDSTTFKTAYVRLVFRLPKFAGFDYGRICRDNFYHECEVTKTDSFHIEEPQTVGAEYGYDSLG